MRRRLLQGLFLVCIVGAGITGGRLVLYRESSGYSPEARRYVFIAPRGEESYWQEIAEGVKAGDRLTGSETLCMSYVGSETVGTYIRDARLSGAQGIILKGVTEGKEEIQKAVEAGIPVLMYDSDVPESGRTSFVGSDNVAVGRLCAKALLERMGTEGSYVIIVRSRQANSQRERMQGIQEVLEGFPGVRCVGVIEDGGSLPALRQQLMEYDLGKLGGILSLDGVAADNLGFFLSSMGTPQDFLTVVVTDLTESSMDWLEKGEYDVVLSLQAKSIGFAAVQALNRYYGEGVPFLSNTVIDATLVTKENVAEYRREEKPDEVEWNSYAK